MCWNDSFSGLGPDLPSLSELRPDGEAVITTWLQSVVRPYKKASQGILDQCPSQGRLNGELAALECPVEMPLKPPCCHLTFHALFLKALTQNAQMSCGGGQRGHCSADTKRNELIQVPARSIPSSRRR